MSILKYKYQITERSIKMKTKLINETIVLFILLVGLFTLNSCSKSKIENKTTEQKSQQDEDTTTTTIDDKDFIESDEDLTTVDYKEFYDQLVNYGEWIQVNAEDIGMKSKISSTGNSGKENSVISKILGINSAYADAAMNTAFVWKPSPELGVSLTVDSPPEYIPYTNGQWVNSDAGWYFKAPTPWEETVHHQGRWAHTSEGWLWVPGRVWAPAWVDWREDDEYVSWAPLPPSYYLNDGSMGEPQIDDNNYMIVGRNHFIDPDIYKYYNPYHDNGNRIKISKMKVIPGIVIVNNKIINRGPDVNKIKNIYGRNIEMVKIQHVKNFNDVRYTDNEYNVYTPNLRRYKNNGNTKPAIKEPKSFKKYDDIKVRKSDGNESKNEEKNIRKENNGNNNVKQQKGNSVKQQEGNNVKQQKGNNVKQHEGKNVKQTQSHDKGKEKK